MVRDIFKRVILIRRKYSEFVASPVFWQTTCNCAVFLLMWKAPFQFKLHISYPFNHVAFHGSEKSPDFQILPEDLTWHTNSSIPASLKNKQKHTKDSGLSRCQELLYSSYLTLVQASLCGTLWLHIHKALLNCIITCIPVNPAMVPSWKDIFWSSQVLFLQLYVFLESRRAVHRHVWVQTSHSCPVVTRHWGFWSKRTDTWRIRSSCKDL